MTLLQKQILTSQWVSLKQETRIKLAGLLELTRDTSTEVAGGRVICDGYSNQALSAITVERLQGLLNSQETDIYTLFEALINQVEAPVKTPAEISKEYQEANNIEPIDITPKTKKKYGKAKN
jgi:hypothetical protein